MHLHSLGPPVTDELANEVGQEIQPKSSKHDGLKLELGRPEGEELPAVFQPAVLSRCGCSRRRGDDAQEFDEARHGGRGGDDGWMEGKRVYRIAKKGRRVVVIAVPNPVIRIGKLLLRADRLLPYFRAASDWSVSNMYLRYTWRGLTFISTIVETHECRGRSSRGPLVSYASYVRNPAWRYQYGGNCGAREKKQVRKTWHRLPS